MLQCTSRVRLPHAMRTPRSVPNYPTRNQLRPTDEPQYIGRRPNGKAAEKQHR